jgi:uncharacterized protein
MGHTSFQLNRRAFMRAGLSTAGALALGPAFFERAFAAGPVTVGDGPYGPLQPFNSNGIALPAGFSSRQIARGQVVVPAAGGTPYTWHGGTDGQATFPTMTSGQPDGGWILVANSEVPAPGGGGVSGVEFASDGTVERAYRVLSGTTSNCAGGPAPWGKWLSCEEHDVGLVHECDPTTLNGPVSRPAMGRFSHEAVCVDPVGERLYLTEDEGDGCLYRFTPDNYPDLSAGLLEVAVGPVDGDGNAQPGALDWDMVDEPGGMTVPPFTPTRQQVSGAAHFKGGEGIWHDEGVVYFTTKGDGRVWTYTISSSQLEVLYDPTAVGPEAPLSGVDNITVSPSGDIYVCEDGADHDICLITPDFEITRFLKLDPVMHSGPQEPNPLADNETVGVIFSPDGSRMYFGAQRSFGVGGNDDVPAGVVYEVSGPFRQTAGGGNGGDGSAGGGQGGAAGVTGGKGLRAPGARLRARRRRQIPRFLNSGLPIRLELDEAAGVDATLRLASAGGNVARSAGSRLIARARPSVAVNGLVPLRLEPTANARKLLEGRDEAIAKLKVVATDPAGNRTVRRRKVKLVAGDRKD